MAMIPTFGLSLSILSLAELLALFQLCLGNHDAKRLYDDMLLKNNYNPLIRPVGNGSVTLLVKLLLRFSQLNNVDGKNQIVTTNMWVVQEWEDLRLRWNPDEYGGVTRLYVPSKKIWLPDIVVYNNADGDYTVTIWTKAIVHYTGTVRWEPPAIYKSYCLINVKFFPFDEQDCDLKISSWSYDGIQVDLKHLWQERLGLSMVEDAIVEPGMDLKDYYESTEWDLLGVPAQRVIHFYPCCSEPYPHVKFRMILRRKTLFYIVNLIIPCVAINCLTMLTFYLPADSGEKISLSITILLSLSMFQMLLMELIPPTSDHIPLLGTYIVFTMIIVSLSVCNSVMILNANYHSGTTHNMHPYTKKIFFHILPKLLFMRRPLDADKPEEEDTEDWVTDMSSDLEHLQNPYRNKLKHLDVESDVDRQQGNATITSTFIGVNLPNANIDKFCQACQIRNRMYPASAQKAIGGMLFVAKHIKNDDDSNKVRHDWQYVSLVIDRIFLWIYFLTCVVGSLIILLQSPMLYDKRVPMGRRTTPFNFTKVVPPLVQPGTP